LVFVFVSRCLEQADMLVVKKVDCMYIGDHDVEVMVKLISVKYKMVLNAVEHDFELNGLSFFSTCVCLLYLRNSDIACGQIE